MLVLEARERVGRVRGTQRQSAREKRPRVRANGPAELPAGLLGPARSTRVPSRARRALYDGGLPRSARTPRRIVLQAGLPGRFPVLVEAASRAGGREGARCANTRGPPDSDGPVRQICLQPKHTHTVRRRCFCFVFALLRTILSLSPPPPSHSFSLSSSPHHQPSPNACSSACCVCVCVSGTVVCRTPYSVIPLASSGMSVGSSPPRAAAVGRAPNAAL